MARVISVFWSICCKSEFVSVTYDDVLCLALARVLLSLHHVTHKASHDACPGRTVGCCVIEKEINKTKNTWAVTQFPHWRVDVWVLFLVCFSSWRLNLFQSNNAASNFDWTNWWVKKASQRERLCKYRTCLYICASEKLFSLWLALTFL